MPTMCMAGVCYQGAHRRSGGEAGGGVGVRRPQRLPVLILEALIREGTSQLSVPLPGFPVRTRTLRLRGQECLTQATQGVTCSQIRTQAS